MHRKQLGILISVDVIIVAAILFAYAKGTFRGANEGLVGLAVGLPLVLNVAYVSELAGIRFFRPHEPLSLLAPEEREIKPNYPRAAVHANALEQPWLVGSTILVILVGSVVEASAGNVAFADIWPITLLAISLALTSFSFQRNCWRTTWADADPGINLLRCVMLGLLCLVAFTVVEMAFETWRGTLNWNEMKNSYLQQIAGLSCIRAYSYKIGQTIQFQRAVGE